MMTSRLSRFGLPLIHRISLAVGMVAVLALSTAWPTDARADVFTGRPISLRLMDADLEQVLGTFSKVTGFAFVVDSQTMADRSLDHRVSVDFESVPWDQALDEILVAAGLDWTLEGKVLWIHLPSHGPGGDRNFTGDPIKLRLEDADLRKVLTTLAKVTEFTIEFEPDVEGTVSVDLKDIPWDQTLDLLLRISGLDYSQEGDAIRIFRVVDSSGMQLGVTRHQ